MRFGHIFGISAHTEVSEGQKTLAGFDYSKNNGLLIWFRHIHRRRHRCTRLFSWLSQIFSWLCQRSSQSVNLSAPFISHSRNQSCVFVNRGLKPWVSIQQMLPVLYKQLLYHLAVLDNLHGGREMPNNFILELKAPRAVVDISFCCFLPTIAAFHSLSSSDEPVLPLGHRIHVVSLLCCSEGSWAAHRQAQSS